jgi:hypothetical protein
MIERVRAAALDVPDVLGCGARALSLLTVVGPQVFERH